MKICVVGLLLFLAVALAKVTDPAYVPATDTAVVTDTKNLNVLNLNNKSAGTVSCNVKDRGTACGGGVCTLWGPAPLGASGSAASIVVWNFGGIPAREGFTWSCDTANAVVGTVSYQ